MLDWLREVAVLRVWVESLIHLGRRELADIGRVDCDRHIHCNQIIKPLLGRPRLPLRPPLQAQIRLHNIRLQQEGPVTERTRHVILRAHTPPPLGRLILLVSAGCRESSLLGGSPVPLRPILIAVSVRLHTCELRVDHALPRAHARLRLVDERVQGVLWVREVLVVAALQLMAVIPHRVLDAPHVRQASLGRPSDGGAVVSCVSVERVLFVPVAD
mmetsp:Transcript_16483/g.32542  ORF Transcript_16483/g.32542 Transcript_16483/m.32542 type:complete len:215 (-) Transcript_16483:149-793(-)